MGNYKNTQNHKSLSAKRLSRKGAAVKRRQELKALKKQIEQMQEENVEEEDNIQIIAVTSDNKKSNSQLCNETKTKYLEEDKQEKASVSTMPKAQLPRHSVSNIPPVHVTLQLECKEEPLSESQLKSIVKHKENVNRVTAILEDLVKVHGGKLICQSGAVSGFQYTLPTTIAPTVSQATVTPVVQNNSQILSVTQQTKNPPPIKVNISNTSSGPQGNIQLVVDPRSMGVFLGSVTQAQGTATTTTTVASTTPQSQQENYKPRLGRRTKVFPVQQSDIIEEPLPKVTQVKAKPGTATQVVKATTNPQGVTNSTANSSIQQTANQSVRPAEHTSIGGIAVGSKDAFLAAEHIDEAKKNLPDGREFTFNKTTGGRTFPSLVVIARPNLHNKDITSVVGQKERQALDAKVKNVLMFSATNFAEWLIQQGLLRSEQYCTEHHTDGQKSKLKLGMYSDQGTFPYSGGYVWICSNCPDKFVSVFSGSIFQGAPYTPTILLKLIYHWACQTNVQNVISWVKVSNVYLKNFYTNLRSICTAAIWNKARKMGGNNAVIQVGVISLGTTSQDGHLRQVKVEVLGVLDPTTLEIRLRACEPMQEGNRRSFKRRFNSILYPLKDWVHTDSRIMTDFTVDKSTLNDMGYSHVMQSGYPEQNSKNLMSNYHVMEYLRKIVPRMFQNTLSLLSRPMIQQFLDELIWREMYGATSERAFDNIIRHIAEQTKTNSTDSLLDRLAKIAANPFQDWSYSKTEDQETDDVPVVLLKDTSLTDTTSSQNKIPETIKPGPKRGRKRTNPAVVVVPEHEIKKIAIDFKNNEKEKESNNEKQPKEQIQLQEFYYATMEGDKNLISEECKSFIHFKCFLCTTIMKSNIEVMEHMISHVPPQVPGQSELFVCRYCCTALSSQHQILTHVSEVHSNFGHSDGLMVVCAICEEKFGKNKSLIDHLSSMHYPSEMPYQCESCNYRTSSHKDVIDHYYKIHEKGEGLQCPYCLKVIHFMNKGNPNASSVYTYLSHMQRHIVRRDQGKGNKCTRCCLWFNQKSLLVKHQRVLHDPISDSKAIPYSGGNIEVTVLKDRPNIRFSVDSPPPELPFNEKIQRWSTGPISINTSVRHLPCQECEEDIDEEDHYPGEQQCQQCRYITCCWRAFREHQQQIHNERPKTSLIVPSPLINIPLERKMQCQCGYETNDGNQLASHMVRHDNVTVAYSVEKSTTSGMLNSLGLFPKSTSEEADAHKKSNSHN
ncbi:uncharacterized protein LOC109860088 isoform X3 [Pseudomyrmex gracilis]|uniref:uncharacterized protein LOC109860088 isoform X3 n=1 Tax=Pseudomyrmex gracilis TaxID=219809 RepID=UPI000995DCC5|nr:uncharacterized protein LOC109860088 isoform X3 [Pseudomyrmex gracilis]